ncbi:hypothetical protein [Lentzea flava]|uniref:ABM domain-containing protein n=1 Tax=Lentzea flava TaxID=103732 RepID=A0ABQ2UK80_9PSEU|nr:hypothetical protein [Lentzea flava]MCP2199758.1 hypothetical protein [Lentzea flava]GGU38510.1 hypothetical protein GCM10010178_33510 [Lentzea flava]
MWLTIATPPTKSLDHLDKVMGVSAPDGLRARYACQADGEFRIIAVWETKEHADRFFREVLGPILARVLGPEPSGAPAVTGMEVLREFIPATAG